MSVEPSALLSLFVFAFALSASAGDILGSIDEVNRVSDSSATNAPCFDLSGQVLSIHSNGRFNVVTIADGHSTLAFADMTTNACQCGDVIRIQGRVNRNPRLGEKGIFANALEVTGNKPLPESEEAITPINWQKPFGKLQGVISDVIRDEMDANYNWIVLRTPYGDLCASATEAEYPLESLVGLVDAEVLLRGTTSRGPDLRKPGGLNLSLFGKNGIEVLIPPSADPFAASHVGHQSTVHRQRICGSVVAVGHDVILVRLDDGRFLQAAVSAPVTDIAPGDAISAVGFVTTDAYALWLGGAIIRRDPAVKRRPLETPREMPESGIFPGRPHCIGINPSLHGSAIRIRGTLSCSHEEALREGVLRLDLNHHSVVIDTFSLPQDLLASLEAGMKLEVGGICLAQFKTDGVTSVFPAFHRFMIVPRSANDIAILARPPWWTATKFLVLITVLVILIFSVLVWNRSLRILSERRGLALSLALTARVRAESRTQERTRLALELHDSISQSLTGVALQIDAATSSSPIDATRRNAYLSTAKNLLASCRKALQDCLWDLRSRTFEEKNLTEAISRTLAPFLNKCTILVRFNVPRETLSESATHAVLSIIRELTSNALRHGHATHVRIAGEFKDGSVRFSVTDNGIGFDTEQAPGPRDGHFGLQGIRERINDFNGTFNLSSAPGKGTKTTIVLAVERAMNVNEESPA